MRYSGMTERDEDGPWFSIGALEVTTTVLVVVVWAATLILWAVEPLSKPITSGMQLIPEDVATGQVWRLFTWPFAHRGFGLFDIINAAMFWYFGTDLEKEIGRRRFAILLSSSIVIIGLSATIFSLLLPTRDALLSDLGLLTLVVVLLYIAEHPLRPFFFGIPAWVIGAVIVALELVNDLSSRNWIRFLSIVVAAAFIMLVARKVQLLTMYDWVPNIRLPRRKNGKDGKQSKDSFGRPKASPSKDPRGPKQSKRPGPLWGKGKEDEPAEILQMPPRRRPLPSTVPDQSADDLALDALLDKIADGGLDALTPAERQELTELRERRRRPKPS